MYKVISTLHNMSVRSDHTTYAATKTVVCKLTPIYGDVTWTAQTSGSQVAQGDTWMHVTKYGDIPVDGWIAIVHLSKEYCSLTKTPIYNDPDISDLKTITAIPANKAGIALNTYANILLRPVARLGVKDSQIVLTDNEIIRIAELLDCSAEKWRWVVGDNHTRYIYMSSGGKVRITSISGYYSGPNHSNQFHVLAETEKWWKVETIRAGSDWWQKQNLPPYLLHRVYTFKGSLPKCGEVKLPVITRTGYAWIEKWQAVV